MLVAVLLGWFIMSPGHGPYGEIGSFQTQAACQIQLTNMPLALVLLDKHKNDFQCKYGAVTAEKRHL